jgi:hypothetical protein
MSKSIRKRAYTLLVRMLGPVVTFIVCRSPRIRDMVFVALLSGPRGVETFNALPSPEPEINAITWMLQRSPASRRIAIRLAVERNEYTITVAESLLLESGLGALHRVLYDRRTADVVCGNRKILRRIIRSKSGRTDLVEEVCLCRPVLKAVAKTAGLVPVESAAPSVDAGAQTPTVDKG